MGTKVTMHKINPISDNVPAWKRINFRVFLIVLDSDESLIVSVEVAISSVNSGDSSAEAADPEVAAARLSIAPSLVSDEVAVRLALEALSSVKALVCTAKAAAIFCLELGLHK